MGKAIGGLWQLTKGAHGLYSVAAVSGKRNKRIQRATYFNKYNVQDFARDTYGLKGYRARTNDIGSRLWNNRSVIEEALRRQNKLAEEQITLLRAREKRTQLPWKTSIQM